MWKASLGTSTRSWILQQYWGSIPLLRWEPVCCQHSAHWFLPSPPCCLCNAWADTHREVTTGEAGVVQIWLQTSCVSVLPQDSKATLWKKEPFNVRFSSHSTLCFNLLDTASQYNLCMFRLLRLMLMWGVTFFAVRGRDRYYASVGKENVIKASWPYWHWFSVSRCECQRDPLSPNLSICPREIKENSKKPQKSMCPLLSR